MTKFYSLIILFLFLSTNLFAQIFPHEGIGLNYRIIGFVFPVLKNGANCKLEIASGKFGSRDSFEHNIITSLVVKTNRIIAEVPKFGSQYTWRVSEMNENGSVISVSELHHFSTLFIQNVDTAYYRMRVMKQAEAYKDGYVFMDDSKILYDMRGAPVWFLPSIDGISLTPRDIKLSCRSTITLLFNPPYEINYNGEVLWRGSRKGIVSKDYTENCHHEFTRISNGHYMVLGSEYVYWKQNSSKPGDIRYTADSTDTLYKRVPFGTIIEYDEKGNIVWSWKSSEYFPKSDVRYFVPPPGPIGFDVHENAFFFDEKKGYIYISYKNINRIVKLKYPEGKVVANYGEIYKPGGAETGNGLFCGQHSCNLSKNGYIYLFNNNTCNAGVPPKLIVMKEPAKGKDGLQKVWEYQCVIDSPGRRDPKLYSFISGGAIQELPDESYFACMNGTYSKLFIVNKEKKETWSALAERWNERDARWEMVGQYRAYLIDSREKLEQLIWNSVRPE